MDDEAVAVVDEAGFRGNGERGGIGPPGTVLDDRPAGGAFASRGGNDGMSQAPPPRGDARPRPAAAGIGGAGGVLTGDDPLGAVVTGPSSAKAPES